MPARRAWLVGMIVTAASCIPGSPQSEFFLLEPRDPAYERPQPNPLPLTLASVVLPPELERSELVRYRGNGQVELLETLRWAAPLDDMVYRTLTLNLAARLERVVLPGQPKPAAPTRALDLIIERFGAEPGGRLTLEALWTLSADDEATLLERRSVFTVDLPRGAGHGIAEAMSHALGRLADEIAAEIPAA